MDYQTRSCGLCSKSKLISEFVPAGANSLFAKDGISTVCYDCVTEMIEFNDLDSVDKLCQFLDIPFMANDWLEIYKKNDNKRLVLETYIKKVRESEFAEKTWKEYSLMWEKARETDTVLAQLPALSADLFIYLRKKWGSYDDFGVEDYLKMESYEKNTKLL